MRPNRCISTGLLVALLLGLWPSNAYVQIQAPSSPTAGTADQPYLVKFNNIEIIEVLRFLSRITGKNFIFNEEEMQFRITLLSEEPSSVDNIMAALMQVLRINGFTMLEQGNNIIIHTNLATKRIPHLKGRGLDDGPEGESELVTQVYRLINVPPATVSSLVEALLSADAQVEVVQATGHLVVTDFASNIARVTQLIEELDSSRPTLEIGQYLVRNAPVLQLSELAVQILDPIAGEQTLQISPSPGTNSIFIVSTPYLVEKSISVLQTLDLTNRQTRILSLDRMEIIPDTPGEEIRYVPTDEERRTQEQERSAERERLEALVRDIQRERDELLRERERDRAEDQERERQEEQERELTLDPRDEIREQIANLIQRIATEDLSTDQVSHLRNRINVLNDMLGVQEQQAGKRIELEGVRGRLEARRGEIQNRLSQQVTEQERAALEDELRDVRGQVEQLEDENRASAEATAQRVEELASTLRDLIDNPPAPPAPVVLDIRQDTRRGGPEGLVSDIPDIVRVTQYNIYNLKHRRAAEAMRSLTAIGQTLDASGDPDIELIQLIRAARDLEENNQIILSGTPEALERATILLDGIDTPQRQVFIELLILESSIVESLNFGVQWGLAAQDSPTWAGSTGFFLPDSALAPAIGSTIVGAADGASIRGTTGGHAGVVGKWITWNGTAFASVGALVKAIKDEGTNNVIMNPKVLVEDGNTAEVFVGINTRFQTQTITNEGGDTLSTNFEYRDVGSTLRVSPSLGDGDMIVMDVSQDFSATAGDEEERTEDALALGPTTRISRTNTRVHVPDRHFLVLSGMVLDERSVSRRGLPCLGSIPYLGTLFSDKTNAQARNNLLIFIRPMIINTREDMAELNKKGYKLFQAQQGPFVQKDDDAFDYDISAGLDFLDVYESYN